MVARLLQTIQTNKRAVLFAGSGFVALAVALIFQGDAIFGAAGKGGSWVVSKVVHKVAYKSTAPEAGEQQIELARASVQPKQATDSGTAVNEMTPVAEAVQVDAEPEEILEPLPLRTPVTEEREKLTKGKFERYRSLGLRDPMVPLVVAGKAEDLDGRFSIYNLILVGSAWKSGDRVALLEDPSGKSFLLRKGDLTDDGARVVAVTNETITFALVRYGETTRITLKLAKKKEDN